LLSISCLAVFVSLVLFIFPTVAALVQLHLMESFCESH
jgi:hypothetical protein